MCVCVCVCVCVFVCMCVVFSFEAYNFKKATFISLIMQSTNGWEYDRKL